MTDITLKESTHFARTQEINGRCDISLTGIEEIMNESKTITWQNCSKEMADTIEQAFNSRQPLTFSNHLRFLEYGTTFIEIENL